MSPVFYNLPAPRSFRSRSLLLPLLGLLLLPGRTTRADVALTLEVKEGDKISDIAGIVAKAESGDGIDKVEFTVDEKPRFKATAVPYLFSWDTILDTEGAHKLTVTATDANGQTKMVTVSVTIDNELNLGADALARKAMDALAAKDYDGATRFSRRALKADSTNIDAARVLAGILADKLDWNSAIATLEKAKNLNDSAPALLEMASYRMRRLLLPENAPSMANELQAVTDLRHKAADLALKETQKRYTGQNSVEAHEAIGDALLATGRYHEAAREYAKSTEGGDSVPHTSLSRQAIALAMDERPQEALSLLNPLVIMKATDPPLRAALGLAFLRGRRFSEARNTVQPDLANHYPAAVLVAAYADVALGKEKEARAEANEAMTLLPHAAEARYAFSMVAIDPRDAEHALFQTMTLAPFQYGPYLDYATRVAMQVKISDRFDQALNITDFVLKNDPENASATLTQALVLMQIGKANEAAPLLNALFKKYNAAPDVALAVAIYYTVKDNDTKAIPYLDIARKQDPVHFDRSSADKPLEFLYFLNRKMHYRAGFFLTPAALYPTKPAVAAAP